MNKFNYKVKETEFTGSIETLFGKESLCYVAEECAAHYFSQGGFECTWPMVFEIYSGDILLGVFKV